MCFSFSLRYLAKLSSVGSIRDEETCERLRGLIQRQVHTFNYWLLWFKHYNSMFMDLFMHPGDTITTNTQTWWKSLHRLQRLFLEKQMHLCLVQLFGQGRDLSFWNRGCLYIMAEQKLSHVPVWRVAMEPKWSGHASKSSDFIVAASHCWPEHGPWNN